MYANVARLIAAHVLAGTMAPPKGLWKHCSVNTCPAFMEPPLYDPKRLCWSGLDSFQVDVCRCMYMYVYVWHVHA